MRIEDVDPDAGPYTATVVVGGATRTRLATFDVKGAAATGGFRLSRALPGSFTYLAIGLNRIDVPFYGGTLVPDFDYIVILPIDADGFADALGPWPAGVPSGFEIYAQFWVSDPGALYTLSGSNAVIGVTP